MAHLEIIATLVYKLTKNATLDDYCKGGAESMYIEHGKDLFYVNSAGVPFTVAGIGAKGDPIANLQEDMAAEQKARATYNHLMNFSDDPGVIDSLRFLREREIVHFQRFGEALDDVQEFYACKKVF